MRSSAKTKSQSRRSRRKKNRRGHVRSVESDSSATKQQPRRIRPRSQGQVGRSPSVTQRRAERKARKKRDQVQSAAGTTRHRVNLWQWLNWRIVSGMLVIWLVITLYLLLTADAFFVSSVEIGGERYLSREEIFRFSGIAQRHLFWIDAEEVETRLIAMPNIADATVLVGWPPNAIQIMVVEREPALIWEQGVRVWVDVNGIVMKQSEDQSGMLRIMVRNAEDPISVGQRIPQAVVDGALFLNRRHPNIDVLLYDSLKGLGYHDGRGWTVWFGMGENMEAKLLVYNQLVTELVDRVQPGEVFMTDPDRPYYTVLWREG